MREQRGLAGPTFGKHQPERVFAVNLDAVGDATRFGAGAVNVLKTDPQQFVQRFGAGDDGTGDENQILVHQPSIAWRTPRRCAKDAGMEQLPIFVNLRGRRVLVTGTGEPAAAKARLVEAAGGVVVTEFCPSIRLAFVASDDAEIEAAALKAAGLLVNVVDRPELCDFTTPSIIDRAPVTLAIGTAGASATLAKALRERLEALLPASLGALATAIRGERALVNAALPDPSARRRFWDALLAPGGTLDPLREAMTPAAVIAATLAAPVPPQDSLTIITVTDPDDLTLRQLRALSQADTIFHTAASSPSILDRARRDAPRTLCTKPPLDLPAGRSVFVGP